MFIRDYLRDIPKFQKNLENRRVLWRSRENPHYSEAKFRHGTLILATTYQLKEFRIMLSHRLTPSPSRLTGVHDERPKGNQAPPKVAQLKLREYDGPSRMVVVRYEHEIDRDDQKSQNVLVFEVVKNKH